MPEQEKIDIMTFLKSELSHVNDNIESLKDFLDLKYASKDELKEAKESRDNFCLVREEKLDKKFTPVYIMLFIIICFLCAKYGLDFLTVIGKVL